MSSWSDVVACASDDAAATLLEHGVAVIPNAVDDATVDACRTRAIEDLAACEAAVAQRLEALDPTAPDAHHEAVRCERCDFAELVRRDGGRYDVRVRCGDAPYADLFRHEAILPAARAALGGGDVVLLYSGVMVARAGAAEDQKWHKDGDHLFAEGGDQPPHALTVFIPLQDLTPSNGPTEFRLGSHRRSAESPPKRSRRSPVAPTCARGSALLFDYRVDHRGLANRSDADRLVVFMAYARPWFRDAKNTRSKVPLFPATFAPWAPRALAADAADDSVLHGDDSGERFVLFEMTVDLGETSGTIRVHDGDDAMDLARAFCERHALDESVRAPLADSILEQAALARGGPGS